MIGDPVASSPVTEPCPHCGCPVADGEWFEDDEGTASCTCCALRDKCDPNDPDCTCRREDAIVQEHADAGTESAYYDRAVLVEILVYHYRVGPGKGCGCGWAELGRSWPEHVATVYEESVRART